MKKTIRVLLRLVRTFWNLNRSSELQGISKKEEIYEIIQNSQQREAKKNDFRHIVDVGVHPGGRS